MDNIATYGRRTELTRRTRKISFISVSLQSLICRLLRATRSYPWLGAIGINHGHDGVVVHLAVPKWQLF